jgi:peptide chain release factor 2
LEEKMGVPGFWDDQKSAQRTIGELKQLKERVDGWDSLHKQYEDLEVYWQLALEERDAEAVAEIQGGLKELQAGLEGLALTTLLGGPYDHHDAILSIHAGAGGTEAQDWAQMLLRMYTRWGEDQGMTVETLDLSPGDEAGIKSVTLSIKGPYAYGYLRGEKGVHRLVRISPFDASGRRHTSFASVDVIPEMEEDVEVEINPADLKIDTYRASGAGGQHVNKTDSAVRITHMPTGIVVQSQSERSQHQNREFAMRILRSRLAERKRQEQQAKVEEIRGDQGEIAWGNQIRSYVFCPYTMVKDHRTNVETGNVDGVMDGELTPFIEGYLRHQGGQ